MGLPVYNGVEYLRETLESVRAQTFKDWELIISDNGSTDGTMEIIQEYAAADERIQYRVHPKNVGAHRNYNSIVPHATGQYFKWLAHDDLMAETMAMAKKIATRSPLALQLSRIAIDQGMESGFDQIMELERTHLLVCAQAGTEFVEKRLREMKKT